MNIKVALPPYYRSIVQDIYAETQMPPDIQEQTEWAMAMLLEHGKTFCVEFGVLNAIEMAMRDGLLPTNLEPNEGTL